MKFNGSCIYCNNILQRDQSTYADNGVVVLNCKNHNKELIYYIQTRGKKSPLITFLIFKFPEYELEIEFTNKTYINLINNNNRYNRYNLIDCSYLDFKTINPDNVEDIINRVLSLSAFL